MLGILTDIFDIFTNIPAYILYAAESFINGLFSVIEAAVLLAVESLPTLPEVEPPPLIGEINWFFPLGAVLAIATPLVAAYVLWLGVRWLFKWAGDL